MQLLASHKRSRGLVLRALMALSILLSLVSLPSTEVNAATGVDDNVSTLTETALASDQAVAEVGASAAIILPSLATSAESAWVNPTAAHYDQTDVEGSWTPPVPPEDFQATDEATTRGEGEAVLLVGGRMEVAFSQAAPGAVVRYQPLDGAESGSPLGIAFELAADGADLDLVASPITLTLSYRDLTIPYRAAAESRLTLFQQAVLDDRGTVAWQPLPTEVDLVGKTLTATASGLGRFMLGTTSASDDGDFTLQPGGGMDDYQVSLAMGSATASYGFPAPPGKAGPVPDVALNYNSLRVDGISNLRNNQPGWAGIGWSLETG